MPTGLAIVHWIGSINAIKNHFTYCTFIHICFILKHFTKIKHSKHYCIVLHGLYKEYDNVFVMPYHVCHLRAYSSV